MSFRERPEVRAHRTFELNVGTEKFFVSLGRYEDGTAMEVFVDIQKEGTVVRGLVDAVARLTSRSWQFGVPVDDVLEQFIGTGFEPNGIGHGHPAIDGQHCGSILDAIGRVLKYELEEHRGNKT